MGCVKLLQGLGAHVVTGSTSVFRCSIICQFKTPDNFPCRAFGFGGGREPTTSPPWLWGRELPSPPSSFFKVSGWKEW